MIKEVFLSETFGQMYWRMRNNWQYWVKLNLNSYGGQAHYHEQAKIIIQSNAVKTGSHNGFWVNVAINLLKTLHVCSKIDSYHGIEPIHNAKYRGDNCVHKYAPYLPSEL